MSRQRKVDFHEAALRVIEKIDSDISQEEIARRAAIERAAWTPEQEQSRRVGGGGNQCYTITTCSLIMRADGHGKRISR